MSSDDLKVIALDRSIFILMLYRISSRFFSDGIT